MNAARPESKGYSWHPSLPLQPLAEGAEVGFLLACGGCTIFSKQSFGSSGKLILADSPSKHALEISPFCHHVAMAKDARNWEGESRGKSNWKKIESIFFQWEDDAAGVALHLHLRKCCAMQMQQWDGWVFRMLMAGEDREKVVWVIEDGK